MKRVALATALACVAMSASAADVTVYGRVDTGLLYEDNGTTQSVSMNSGGAGASRWGLKGSEKIGDMTVGFQLEGKITTDAGQIGDEEKLFDRDAYIYVKSPYGDVRFGRSGALGGGVSGGIFGGKASPFGMSWGNAAASKIYAVESRHDNMVRYDTPRMAGLKFAGAYSFGTNTDDSAPESKNNRYLAVGADYKVGGFNVVAVFDEMRWADQEKDTKNYKVAVNYKLDPVTFYAGYQMSKDAVKVGGESKIAVDNDKKNDIKLVGADVEALTFGARVAAGGGTFQFVVGYANGDNEVAEATIKQVGFGYSYKLSKQLTAYAAASYLDTEKEVFATKLVQSNEVKQVMAGLAYVF